MNFDILVDSKLNDEIKIFAFGKDYLKDKSFKDKKITAKECKFCHIEEATDSMKNEIQTKGYYIIEMENCN